MPGDLVVVDTSAWIFTLRRPAHAAVCGRVDRLLREDRVAMVPPVRTELLGGTRSAAEWDRLASRLAGLHLIPFEDVDWETAASWKSKLRRSGLTVPTLDLLIAAPTVRAGAILLHADNDFDRAAQHIGLRVESLVSVVSGRP